MALLHGRATFQRFKVIGPAVRSFGEEHIERLSTRAAGTSRVASADGIDVGWITGEHALDTDFDLAKNIVNDALCFAVRVDSETPPGYLLAAYTAIELKALAKDNPSGFASAKQKREAKQSARERLEEEAKDGRFKKRTIIPCLWDSKTGELLFGATSYTHLDRLCSLLAQTFGLTLEVVTAGRLAFDIAEGKQLSRFVDDAKPTKFVADSPAEMSWVADDSSRDWLGNEFLLWLWYALDQVDDTFTLSDKSDVTVMLARILNLDCPRGMTGQDAFRTEGPTRLPEAKRAAQSGKLPRRAGVTMVRHDKQYEFALYAETFAVGAAKLPLPGEDVTDARARLEDRVEQIRDFIQAIDLIYGHFLETRLTKAWAGESVRIQEWLVATAKAKAA